jgi:wobble nucleotide-excising tRNase
MAKQIKTKITCENLAPLLKFDEEIESDTLKIAIFANNGSGKTFLSRMFRLAEKEYVPIPDEKGKLPTDKLISFEKNKCSFSLKITSKENVVSEDFAINISKGNVPLKPTTKYIYHCFNQDYVEENIRTLSYEKDSNIVGFILGKANIDVSKEKEIRFKKSVEKEKLVETLKKDITKYISDKIGSIPNINRLSEYKSLNVETVIAEIDSPFTDVPKSYKDLLNDYNRIKSVPENLADIKQVQFTEIAFDEIATIQETLKTAYTLGSFAEAFKEKVKSKQEFIETGLELISENNICPFCEQTFNEEASNLIDQYTKFLADEEAKTVKLLNQQKDYLRTLLKQFIAYSNEVNDRIILYTTYSTKYIPSLENTKLESLGTDVLKELFTTLAKEIDKKIKKIDTPLIIEKKLIKNIESQIISLQSVLEQNNQKVKELNSKLSSIDSENKEVRRNLCKAVFNDIAKIQKTNVDNLSLLTKELFELDIDIREKEEKQKVSKKKKVAETVKSVLKYFFGDKYSLDKDSFRLTLNEKILDEGQAKDVLSDGEKNVIAFAYFIGDIHLKVEKEDDYNNLLFVVDDPISSMDFNHVYSICGIMRNLKEIIKSDRERFIILTHNLDFMRVLAGNNIVSKSFLLKDSKLKEFNNNLTVPYISHLHDIYKVANKTESPKHTTANSIRHIIETLNKFENIDSTTELISKYIKDNVPEESKTYTLINDLSHGGWRTEQAPINDDDFILVCQAIVAIIDRKYKGQLDYCAKLN